MTTTLVGETNINRLIERFPEVLFFESIAITTFARMMTILINKGCDIRAIQEVVDGDEFITVLAGSVYAQISGMPSFGCDDRSGRFK